MNTDQKKERNVWFINSRGEVHNTEDYWSAKHQKRVAYGNAFPSKKIALAAQKATQEHLQNIAISVEEDNKLHAKLIPIPSSPWLQKDFVFVLQELAINLNEITLYLKNKEEEA